MTTNTSPSPRDQINTSIWQELPEADNPFATRTAYCRGYDVFGDMMRKAGWVDMLWLLLRPNLPSPSQRGVLEALAVVLANPGPREASVHAAMCAGVGGSPAAAALVAALSVGAGRYGGARDLWDAMTMWALCGAEPAAWRLYPEGRRAELVEAFPEPEYVPGFDPHGASTAVPVRQLLATVSDLGAGWRTKWLSLQVDYVCEVVGLPLAVSGAVACVLHDLGFTAAEGEMLYLLLRLPGAAAHALEQQAGGFKQFPFYSLEFAAPKEAQ